MPNNKLYNIYDTHIGNLIPGTTYAIAYDQINENDKILEIGCATGYWGEYAKTHKNVEIYGLDYLNFHVEKAREKNCYEEVIQYDLNNLDNSLDRLNGYFDKIVMLDVIEHLYNPKAVLNWCKEKLKPNGHFIISVPNVCHKSIIHQLLLNQFNYTEQGLLDRTHIRFFTPNMFVKLLLDCGFRIPQVVKIANSFSEYERAIPEEINRYINNLPETDGYQYVYTAVN